MSWLSVDLADNRKDFLPGQTIEGTIRWHLEEAPKNLQVRLFWYTQGKGTQDLGIVDSLPVEQPSEEGSRQFSFKLPDGPYSFSGKLISLLWAIEVVAEPSAEAQRCEITVSPNGREIILQAV